MAQLVTTGITGSLTVLGNINATGYNVSASFISASYISASFITCINGFSGSLYGTALFSSQSLTSNYALFTNNASNANFAATASTITGSPLIVLGFAANIKTISSSYTASNTDYTILCKNTASIGIYLTSSFAAGTLLNIKNAGTYGIIVTPSSGSLVDGQSSWLINKAYTNMQVQWDGINWWNL